MSATASETLAALDARRRELIAEAQALDLQLAGTDPRGYRHGPDYLRWRRETVQLKASKQHELAQLKRQIGDVRAAMLAERPTKTKSDDAQRDYAAARNLRIETKLDLLLAALGVTVPPELHRPAPPDVLPEDDDVARDQHGTPYDDAMNHRVPGSFENGKRR